MFYCALSVTFRYFPKKTLFFFFLIKKKKRKNKKNIGNIFLQSKSWLPGSSKSKMVPPFNVQCVGVTETDVKVTNIRILMKEVQFAERNTH